VEHHQTLADAAREGARRAVVRDGPAAAKVGDANAPGTVPAVLLDRLRRAGILHQLARGTGGLHECGRRVVSARSTRWAGARDRGCGWGRATASSARRHPPSRTASWGRAAWCVLAGGIDGRTFETNIRHAKRDARGP
jgi:hypothetical protein